MKNINMDSSTISQSNRDCLFYHLRINGRSMHHGDDKRKGDEIKVDKNILITLGRLPSDVKYLVFVLNSYSSHGLANISKKS